MTMLRSLATAVVLSAVSTTTTSAFQPVANKASLSKSSNTALNLFGNANDNGNNAWASLAVAGTVFASTLTGSVALPAPAHADVELSEGAIIVQTSAKQGQSLLKAEVDAKDLLGNIIKNRKALKESVGRIATVVKEELQGPVWSDLAKEVLQIEGDVTPEVKVLPPRDVQQTLRDISKGKLNLIVNGEIINLSVDKSSTAAEDEIIIRAKGVRGVGPIAFSEPAVTEVRTRLQDQIDAVRDFWYAPIAVPSAIQDKLPEDFEVDTGVAIVVGGTTFIVGVYSLSYAYYVSEQAAAAAKAEAQRQKVAARKKAAAEAAAKKKAEEEAKEE